jgi:hypothetical protein
MVATLYSVLFTKVKYLYNMYIIVEVLKHSNSRSIILYIIIMNYWDVRIWIDQPVLHDNKIVVMK